MSLQLGEILLMAQLIDFDQLKRALRRQQVMGGRLGTNLLEMRFINERQLVTCLAKQRQVPPALPEVFQNIEREIIECIPLNTAAEYLVIPYKLSGNTLSVAMVNPQEIATIDLLGFISGKIIRVAVALEARVQHSLHHFYGRNVDFRYISVLRNTETEEKDVMDRIRAQTPVAPLERLDIHRLRRSFLTPHDSQEILSTLLQAVSRNCERVILFEVENNSVTYWDNVGEYNQRIQHQPIQMDFNQPSIILDLETMDSFYHGTLPPSELNAQLVGTLENNFPDEIILLPFHVSDNHKILIYADNLFSGRRISGLDQLHIIYEMAFHSLQMLSHADLITAKLKQLGTDIR